MTVIHRLTGYDKSTEMLSLEFTIPAANLQEVRALANVPEQDAGIEGSYPLNTLAAHRIALGIHQTINFDLYDWFIEPFAES